MNVDFASGAMHISSSSELESSVSIGDIGGVTNSPL